MCEKPVETDLSRKARRVQDYIQGKGFNFTVREMPGSTRTAKDAADAVGCEVAQIAKSLVFINPDSGEPVLVIASGTNRVSLEKITGRLNQRLVQADGKFVKERLGFAIGGVPPVGYEEKLLTLLDLDLKQYDRIWAAAGTPRAVFELTPEDLGELTQGLWMDLAEMS